MLEKRTCPLAINTAVTMLEACALKPPILPATAEPYKFLLTFKSTRSRTLVLRTVRTTDAGTTASHTTDFPRPSTLETITQFT